MDASRLPVYCGEDQVPNIYEATQDIYVTDTCVDEELIKKSPYQYVCKASPVVLDPLAPDYKDVFVERGTAIAPDELLHMMRPSALKIPLKLREDFDSDPLPDPDLVQAIQYYASTAKITPCSMDETALLALGSLVESWVDEELKACDPNLFMEPPAPADMSKYAPPESEESDEEAFSEEDAQSDENGADFDGADSESDHQFAEESDVMSLELSESDTASEVEGGRGIKRRKINPSKNKSGSGSAKGSFSSESKDSSSENSDSDSDSDDSDSDSDGRDSNSDGEDSEDSSKSGSGKEVGNSAEKEKPASHMDIGASSSESHSESGGEEGASGARSDKSDPELLEGYADASDNLSSD